MTDYFKKIMAAAALGLVLVTPTLAADRTDCLTSLTEYTASAVKVAPDFKVDDLDATALAALLDKVGPPPATPPYTIAVAAGTIDGELMRQLVVHDADCIVFNSPTNNLDALLNMFGAARASN